MKHWHYSRPSGRAVSHSHEGGNRTHAHLSKGWLSYGRTKRVVERNIRDTEKR